MELKFQNLFKKNVFFKIIIINLELNGFTLIFIEKQKKPSEENAIKKFHRIFFFKKKLFSNKIVTLARTFT